MFVETEEQEKDLEAMVELSNKQREVYNKYAGKAADSVENLDPENDDEEELRSQLEELKKHLIKTISEGEELIEISKDFKRKMGEYSPVDKELNPATDITEENIQTVEQELFIFRKHLNKIDI